MSMSSGSARRRQLRSNGRATRARPAELTRSRHWSGAGPRRLERFGRLEPARLDVVDAALDLRLLLRERRDPRRVAARVERGIRERALDLGETLAMRVELALDPRERIAQRFLASAP